VNLECFSGLIGAGNNFHTTVSVPGSNPLRIGHVNAVRMVFNRKLFKGKKVFVKKVKVYQANVTIEAVRYKLDSFKLKVNSMNSKQELNLDLLNGRLEKRSK